MNYRFLFLASACLVIAACGNSTASTEPEALKCGAGQKQQFNADTGKAYCVGDTDSAGLSDGTGQGTDSDTAIGKDQTGGGKDAVDAGSKDAGGKDTGGGVTDEEDILSGQAGCPTIPKEVGVGKIGETCTKGSDCAYGQCVFGAPVAGYDTAIGFCTRVCGCPAECGKDNAGSVGFGCAKEMTISGGNPKRAGSAEPSKFCTRECKTDADCQKWNPALPDCIKSSTKYVSVSPNGACGKNPLK